MLDLREEEKSELLALCNDATPCRIADRAAILLAASEDPTVSNSVKDLEFDRRTVALWVRRYRAEGIRSLLREAPRSGRPKKIQGDLELDIRAALQTTAGKRPVLAEIARKKGVKAMTLWRYARSMTARTTDGEQ